MREREREANGERDQEMIRVSTMHLDLTFDRSFPRDHPEDRAALAGGLCAPGDFVRGVRLQRRPGPSFPLPLDCLSLFVSRFSLSVIDLSHLIGLSL